MYIPFSSLPDHARIWIYQSDKPMTADQRNIIFESLKSFTEQWTVHGSPVDASVEIRHDHFVILAANDPASGCSIDSSVRAVQSAGTNAGVDFFNRNLVAFKINDAISLVPLKQLAGTLGTEWNAETLVFNNLIENVRQLKEVWVVPSRQSWLSRYLAKQSISP